MNREFIFNEVINRAKESFGCKTSKALAETIGISPQVMGNRKKTASIPYEEIIAAAMRRGVDVQYILTGQLLGVATQVSSQYQSGSQQALAVAEKPLGYVALKPDQIALLDNLEHCSKEDQEAIKRMALLAAKAGDQEKPKIKKAG